MIINNLTRKEKGFVIFGYFIFLIISIVLFSLEFTGKNSTFINEFGILREYDSYTYNYTILESISNSLFDTIDYSTYLLLLLHILYWFFVMTYNIVIRPNKKSK